MYRIGLIAQHDGCLGWALVALHRRGSNCCYHSGHCCRHASQVPCSPGPSGHCTACGSTACQRHKLWWCCEGRALLPTWCCARALWHATGLPQATCWCWGWAVRSPGPYRLGQPPCWWADGRAPIALRPYLGGARGTALEKLSKTGAADVRPLCAGETLRRLVGKVLLRSEFLLALRAHLLPHQLAVGVPAGAEVMPHLYRQWRQRYQADTDQVCLSFDEGDAHNVVDRHMFLTRMQEVAPGLSRWLEYIYPTDIDTKVFFQDVAIPSAAGGQQGCPLMTACHAVVQRLLLESLGLAIPRLLALLWRYPRCSHLRN